MVYLIVPPGSGSCLVFGGAAALPPRCRSARTESSPMIVGGEVLNATHFFRCAQSEKTVAEAKALPTWSKQAEWPLWSEAATHSQRLACPPRSSASSQAYVESALPHASGSVAGRPPARRVGHIARTMRVVVDAAEVRRNRMSVVRACRKPISSTYTPTHAGPTMLSL